MLVILAAIFGLAVGSTLNSLIWRLHTNKSWMRGRSICPHCEHSLAIRDLVPIISWLWLRGRCHYCHKSISWQYPTIELVTAVLFGLSVWALALTSWQNWLEVGLWLVILCLLIILAVIDLRWYLLLDKLTYLLIVLASVLLLVELSLGMPWRGVWGSLLAGLGAGAFFWAIAAITKGRGMGGGDIKLVIGLGLLLGLQRMVLTLFLAFVGASVVGLALIILTKRSRRDPIPFGPFLIASAVVAYLVGTTIIIWYIGLAA